MAAFPVTVVEEGGFPVVVDNIGWLAVNTYDEAVALATGPLQKIIVVKSSIANGGKQTTYMYDGSGLLSSIDGIAARKSVGLPQVFPATLQRGTKKYYILETGATFYSKYTGTTIYVATNGNDTSGNGSVAFPYLTLDKAISVANNFDKIYINGGQYTPPSAAITKSLAFIAPNGNVYIGTFYNLSTSTITPQTGNIFTATDPTTGATPAGLLRTDGVLVGGVSGTAKAQDVNIIRQYQTLGIMSCQIGSTSANFSLGTNESLSTLIAANKVLAWVDTVTTGFVVSGTAQVYLGNNITIASNASNVVSVLNSAQLVLNGASVYGGSDSTIHAGNTASLIQFNTTICGGFNDNIDYSDTSVGVEVGVKSYWPGIGAASNATTAHSDARTLRVGCTYKGGSRTIHDVDASINYMFSCDIGDVLFNQKSLIQVGFPPEVDNPTTLIYGDLTFTNTYNITGVTNLTANLNTTVQEISPSSVWPY